MPNLPGEIYLLWVCLALSPIVSLILIIDLFGLYNQLLKRLWLYAEYTEILIFGKDAKSLERNLFFNIFNHC